MRNWIVVTTINPPTKAIERIAKLTDKGWRCVVVGDRKTPANWSAAGIDYLGIERQTELFGELAKMIPVNHYCRKNLGYLYAIEHGADAILETDDDNIPRDDFGSDPELVVESDLIGGVRWSNIYKHFSDSLIWPRGNPLPTIHEAGEVLKTRVAVSAPVQQFLADGDPDVDAIYRLLFKEPLNFRRRSPVALAAGTWCSFNSQNTLFFREAFPLLYLPCHVSFRMTDIWRSFVAQAALWSQGKSVVFRSATVVQERNQHDLMKDFKDEVDGYLRNDEISKQLDLVVKDSAGGSLTSVAEASWKQLHGVGIVKTEELAIFSSWMSRCQEKM